MPWAAKGSIINEFLPAGHPGAAFRRSVLCQCGKNPHRLISGGSGFIWKGGDNGPGRFSTNEDSRARNKWGRVTEKKAAGGKKRSAGAARKEGHP